MDDILLDSGLDEYAFGKTNLSSLINDTGFYAEPDSTLTETTRFSFHEWKFDTIRTYGDGADARVFFCGHFFSGTPLSSLFEAASPATADEKTRYNAACAAFAVCRALNQAVIDQLPLPVNGAGGIICSSVDERVQLLFLPPGLFDQVCACRGSSFYAAEQGCWCSKVLSAYDISSSFTQAVIAYRALTGHLPYGAEDETIRNSDISDKNYLRLEHKINGIDSTLTAAVDNALELPAVFLQKKKKAAISAVPVLPAVSLRKELGLCGRAGTLTAVIHPDALPEAEFQTKVTSYYKMKEKKVKASRKLRRNTALISGILVAAALVIVIVLGQHSENGTKPTSFGLTSSETVETFYKGIHTQDIELMDCVSKGKSASRYSDSVSQIYVIGKTRSMYTARDGIITPENWLFYQSRTTQKIKYGVYGITCFDLDGQPDRLQIIVPLRKTEKKPVTKEGGIILSNRCTAVHTAVYYMVHTEDEENNFYVEKHTDKVTLTYTAHRWFITNITADVVDIPVDNIKFRSALLTAFSVSASDPVTAVEKLKPEYVWLPRTTEMQALAEQQLSQINK
jgi:hypothetical protein